MENAAPDARWATLSPAHTTAPARGRPHEGTMMEELFFNFIDQCGYFAVAALGLDEEVRCRPFFEEYVDDASVIIGGLCGDAKEDVGVDEDNAANVCVDDIGDDGNADVVVDAWRDATPCGSVHIR